MNERPDIKASKTAKLFKNGRSQAVRLPAEFRFEGTEVAIRRDTETGDVILSGKAQPRGDWDEFFRLRDELLREGLPEDFMADREQGEQQRDDIFDDFALDARHEHSRSPDRGQG
jgi:antitoxin VapB